MKTSELLLFGVAGLVAYSLFAKGATATDGGIMTSQPAITPVILPAQAEIADQTAKVSYALETVKDGSLRSETFSTPAEGVTLINKAIKSNAAIQPVTQVLQRNVTANVKGEGTLRGNIVKLGSGSVKFVAVKKKT